MPQPKAVFALSAKKLVRGERLTFTGHEYVGQGGSGVVYRSTCKKTGEAVALKLFLPIYQFQPSLFLLSPSKTAQREVLEVQRLHAQEVRCLRASSHPGIVKFVDCGTIDVNERQLAPAFRSISTISFCATEFVDGEQFLDFAARDGMTAPILLTVLRQLCEALTYLHEEKQYLHGDIRPENVRVRRATSAPVLIDFGLYKNLNFAEVMPSQTTRLLGDWDLFPRDLGTHHELKKVKEQGGTRDTIKELAFPALDVFQFGKMLEKATDTVARLLEPQSLSFWHEIVRRLTAWDHARRLTFRLVAQQVEKLSSTYLGAAHLPELAPRGVAPITIQLPGTTVSLPTYADAIVNTRAFRRLSEIRQLACLDLVYPAAAYSRYVHSLATYELCSRFLPNLLRSPQFRFEFDPQCGRLCLLTSLLHDINHFPFLHSFQELPGDFLGDTDPVDLFCSGAATRDSPSLYSLVEDMGVPREVLKQLVEASHHDLVARQSSVGEQVAKSLVDSGADLDRLSYLQYDALLTGVPYGGGIDVTALLRAATVVQVDQGWHLAYMERAVPALENLVLARYWNFRTIYWHHTNRSLMAMLRHAVEHVYLHGARDVREYLVDTVGLSQREVLVYLNERYKAITGEDSLLAGIIDGRRSIYKRVLSLRSPSEDDRDRELYGSLREIDDEGRRVFLDNFRDGLAHYLKRRRGVSLDIGPRDVLWDVPGRRLDDIGTIHVLLDSGEVAPLTRVSRAYSDLAASFDQLAKKARIFVAPHLSEHFDTSRRLADRAELLDLALRARPASITRGAVR